MNRLFRLSMIALLGLVSASASQAALIVDWGGNMVTALRGFQNAAGDISGPSDAGSFGGFTSGNPQIISPTTSSGTYTGGAFYGYINWTIRSTQIENTGNGASILDNSSLDRMELKMGGTDYYALVLWRQADFLNGANTGNVAFDATSTVAINNVTFSGFTGGQVVIRLQGGSNDGYYISQTTPLNGSNAHSASPTSLTWLAYDPATSLTSTGAITNLLSGEQITNVTEIGFKFEAHTNGANALRIDSFEVDAITIPEPATLGLLAVGGLMLFSRRKGKVIA